MPALHQQTIAELAAQLKTGSLTSTALTEHFLARAEQTNDALNAYIAIQREAALAAAQQADEQLNTGNAHPLCGIPIAVKDVFCAREGKTTAGSRMLADFTSPYDAGVIERIKRANMPILGKANMDEFAMGSATEYSYFEAAHNPWDTAKTPGGSSGGSAAIVAARTAPYALGTDTGGSIRQPAAFTGITGIKPTYGSVSRYGMIAFASSLDQGGVMAASARECAALLDVIQGHDARDATSVARAYPSVAEGVADHTNDHQARLDGVKIGVPRALLAHISDASVAKATDTALAVLSDLGAELIDIPLAYTDAAVATYYVIAPAECSSNLARFDGVRYGHRAANPENILDLYKRSREEGFGREVKRRIIVGTYVLSAGYYDAYYRKAQQVRRLIRDEYVAAFNQVDAIAMPVAPTTAPSLGAKLENKADPVDVYAADIFTVPASLAGLPALSMPIGLANGMPSGLQLVGNYFDEARILSVAATYQAHTDWHTQRPPNTA